MTNFSTALIFAIAVAYVLWPGFFMNVGDLCVLAWKQLSLDVRRQVMLWKMKRQMDEDRRQLEKWVEDYRKQEHRDDDVVQ